MTFQEQLDELQRKFDDHRHTNLDNKRVNGKDLVAAPQVALTPSDGGSVNTSGGFITAGSAPTIQNAITRINELEDKLQSLGLIL